MSDSTENPKNEIDPLAIRRKEFEEIRGRASEILETLPSTYIEFVIKYWNGSPNALQDSGLAKNWNSLPEILRIPIMYEGLAPNEKTLEAVS